MPAKPKQKKVLALDITPDIKDWDRSEIRAFALFVSAVGPLGSSGLRRLHAWFTTYCHQHGVNV